MSESKRGWELLHSKLPAAAIRPLATAVYGVAGLSDVNEGHLIQRLFASGLDWEWRATQRYLGSEDRESSAGKLYRVFMFSSDGVLKIDGREFSGAGASDNRKLDAAAKGASTVAFKNACKWAGLTSELYLDGRAIDHIYEGRVTKDPQMASATVEQRIQENLETYPLQKAQEGTQGAAEGTTDAEPETNGSAVLASSETGEDDRQPLYVLARTLKTPRTVLEVDNKIAKQGLGPVRLELILAHGRDCRVTPCIHVSELAGLK